jgi:hypothetical protein
MIFDIIVGTDSSTGTDPYFSSVVLGMHMDGSNGGTSFPDITGKTVTPTNVTTSTTNFKYGTASGYFNGTGRIAIADAGVFSFPGDYTVELWASGDIALPCLFYAGAYTYLHNNQLLINNTSIVSGLGLDQTTTWKHVAITRAGSTVRVFQNGVIKGSGTSSTTHNYTNPYFGYYAPNGNLYFTGYIDDIRITKGVARYTGPFTPPTSAFPNS